MAVQKIGTFDSLQTGDKIISPTDNMVHQFLIDRDGEKYIADDNSAYPYFQFDADDWYIYNGTKEVGEIDKEYMKEEIIC